MSMEWNKFTTEFSWWFSIGKRWIFLFHAQDIHEYKKKSFVLCVLLSRFFFVFPPLCVNYKFAFDIVRSRIIMHFICRQNVCVPWSSYHECNQYYRGDNDVECLLFFMEQLSRCAKSFMNFTLNVFFFTQSNIWL